jgi:hypothetical protein
MGCDIHAVIDYDDAHGETWAFSEIWLPRHYAIFAALAGVRANECEKPLYPPRGLPSSYSDRARWLFFLFVKEDGEEIPADTRLVGYVTRSDAESWVQKLGAFYAPGSSGPRAWVSDPDFHHPSWLTYPELLAALNHSGLALEECWPEFRAAIATLGELTRHYGMDHVRLVFWFDN